MLSPQEITMLSQSREWAGAQNHAPVQHQNVARDAQGNYVNPARFSQFVALGYEFMAVMSANPAQPRYTYVWNHPAPFNVTAIA